MTSELRIALAGGVVSTRRVLQALLRHRAHMVGVLGLAAEVSTNVSGYCRLDDLACRAGVPYLDFTWINAPEVLEQVRKWQPDLLFVVGLSQLVGSELLKIPRLGCIGFHPTWLPQGRGRAPIAWLVLEGRHGAATFFLMDESTDAGPILAQTPFFVSDNDYASDVIAKMEDAIDRALDEWLPRLFAGEWNPVVQNDVEATFYGKRAPEDGLIDWLLPAKTIYALIRAASRPHPGAYTYVDDHKLIIWRAEPESNLHFRGVPGRLLFEDKDRGWLVQTGDGLLWLQEYEFIPGGGGLPKLRVGLRLGYAPQEEIFVLRQRLHVLERRLESIESILKLTDERVRKNNEDFGDCYTP